MLNKKVHVLVFYTSLNWKMHGETVKLKLTGKSNCVNKRLWPVFWYYPDEYRKDSSQKSQSSGRNSSLELAKKKKCMKTCISARTIHENQLVDKSDWCTTETLVITIIGRSSILNCSKALISYSTWVQGKSLKIGCLHFLSSHFNRRVYDIKSIFLYSLHRAL